MTAPIMKHSDIQLLLADYRDLRGEERRAVESHIQGCPACAARLAAYQAMDVELQGLRDARPTPMLRNGYHAAIQGEPEGGERRPAGPRRAWLYGFASVAALLLVVVAAWALLQPGGRRNPGPARSGGGASATPAPTPQPLVVPTADATLDPQLVQQPSWQLIEQELSRKALGSETANRVCDWTVLGRDETKSYVWAYCTAYQGAPDVTAASLPAAITVSAGGTDVLVETPRDGSLYAEDVRALFPPAVQQMIFDRTFDPLLPQLEQHAKLRLKWPLLPPLGASEISPGDPKAWTTSATVYIFSGRRDPTWMLTRAEADELDRRLAVLPAGPCAALPDNLGYRGVMVNLGAEDAGRLIAVNGQVQSGDAGAADAVCLSDPERTVERFLLSSGQANVSDDLKPLLEQLLQPPQTPPAPVLTPTGEQP